MAVSVVVVTAPGGNATAAIRACFRLLGGQHMETSAPRFLVTREAGFRAGFRLRGKDDSSRT